MESFNWTFEKEIHVERAKKVLSTCKQLEKKRIRNGWKYIKLNPTTTIFVPCDKKGKPTKKGQEMINKAKALW